MRRLQLGLTSTKRCDASTGVNYQLLPTGGSHDPPKSSLSQGSWGVEFLLFTLRPGFSPAWGFRSSSTHSLRTNVSRQSKLIDGWISAHQRIGSPKKSSWGHQGGITPRGLSSLLALISLDRNQSTQVQVSHWLLVMSDEAGRTGFLGVGPLSSLKHLESAEAFHLLLSQGLQL